MLEVFNSYNNRLQFTHELEINQGLSFLDLYIIRHNGKLRTNWYQKSTSSGRFLNYNSEHPFEHKKGVIFNLVDRSILLSHPEFHKENVEKGKHLLLNNGYPINIINKFADDRVLYCKNKMDNSHIEMSDSNSKKQNPKFYLKLPYVHKFYRNISRKLNGFDIKVVPKIKYALNRVIKKGKDKVNKNDQVNVVYKVNCNDCDASYVGESKRGVGVRVSEHKRDSKKAHKETPFFKHMVATEHTFDFEGSQILDIEPHYYRRVTSELLNIHAQSNPINIQQDLDKLHSMYKSLFQTIKRL